MKKQMIIKTTAFLLLTFFFTQGAMSQDVSEEKLRERPTPEKIMEKLDENGDSKLTETEVKGPLKKHFAKIDKNEDGSLSMEELRAVSNRKRKGHKKGDKKRSRPTAVGVMECFDVNEDAKLSVDEVKGALKENFVKIDGDEDGFLSIEELKKVPKRNFKGKRTGKRKS